MISYFEIDEIENPRQYLAYAHAYLDSAESLCEKILLKSNEKTWPHASVILLLMAHSVELFLKATIIAKAPGENVNGHDINYLSERYSELHSDISPSWAVPFTYKPLNSKSGKKSLAHETPPLPSIIFRYPTDKDGSVWKGIYAFEPKTMHSRLASLRREYIKIQYAIWPEDGINI